MGILGSLRGVAQTISYDIRLSLVIISVAIIVIRLNFYSIQNNSFFIILIYPMVAIMGFVLIFLAEYASILLFSSLAVRIFLGTIIFSLSSAVRSVTISAV